MQRWILYVALGMAFTAISSLERDVRAGSVGTQGFSDLGNPTANTGNINTATSFTIGDLMSTGASTGVFTGMTTQSLGPVTFNVTKPGSLTFGNSVFGSFTSTSFEHLTSAPGVVAYYVLGNWTPGSYVGGSGSAPASFTVSFNQTPGFGAISDSGSFSIPPATVGVGPNAVPEPASLVMGLAGASALGLVWMYRRGFRKVTA